MLRIWHSVGAAGRPVRAEGVANVQRLRQWPSRATAAALVMCCLASAGLRGGLSSSAADTAARSGIASTQAPAAPSVAGAAAVPPHDPLPLTPATVGPVHAGTPPALDLEASLTAADVLALPAGRQRAEAMDTLVRRWSVRDPSAVAAWIRVLPDPAEQHDALRAAVESVATRDPLRALAMADEFGSGRDDGTLERLVRDWAQADLPAARTWLQTADGADAPLAAHVLQVWAAQDAAGAAQAMALLSDGPARTQTVSAIAAAWAAQDPAAAARWAESLPPADARVARQALTQALLNP